MSAMSAWWEPALVATAIGAVLARIAWRDGTRCEVAWGDVLILGALGTYWQGVGAWASIVVGAALGAGAIVGQIGVSRWLGRRSPVCAGDAMLMGACGALLGPMGLAVSWVANVPAALGYRWWLARRRRRRSRWLRGYVPMAPAYCVSAGVVLMWQAVIGRNGW